MSVSESLAAMEQTKNVVVETTEVLSLTATPPMTTQPKKVRVVRRIVKKPTVSSVNDDATETSAKPAAKKAAAPTVPATPASSAPSAQRPSNKRSLSSRLFRRYGASLAPEMGGDIYDNDDQDDDSDDQYDSQDNSEDDGNNDYQDGENQDQGNEKDNGHDDHKEHDDENKQYKAQAEKGLNLLANHARRTGGQPGPHRRAQVSRSVNSDSAAMDTQVPKTTSISTESKEQSEVQITELLPESPTIKDTFVEDIEKGSMSPEIPQETKDVSLGSGRALNFIVIFVKSINVLFPLFFLTLGILHILRNNKETTDTDPDYTLGWVVESINSVAITLWGIMFAAIAGQALKAYATFQAERGIKLMSLEQLLHSQSFSSAIKQPLLLRRIDITSICLFFLWALSPLTNQALQKMTVPVPGGSASNATVKYLDITSNNTKWSEAWNYSPNEAGSMIYSFAILSNSDFNGYQGTDIWGHPKSPVPISSNVTPGDWVQNNNLGYSSEIGLPIEYNLSDTSLEGSLNFTIPSAYWLLDCYKPIYSTPAEFNKSGAFKSNQSSPSKSLWTAYLDDDSDDYTAGIIAWASLKTPSTSAPNNNTEFVYSACSLSPMGIESNYTCYNGDDGIVVTDSGFINGGKNCVINSARVVPNATFADLMITDFLVGLFAVSNTGTGTSVGEHFMADPKHGLASVEHSTFNSANIWKLNATTFSDRFQRLWNTWYQTLYAQSSYVDSIDTDAPNNTLPTSFVRDYAVYHVQPAWLTVYFISVAVVLAFAILDIYWEYATVSPDFLGFASSVVRSNQHLNRKLRDLGGHEKTKAMAGMKVMLRGVPTKDGNGKIALAPYMPGSSRLDRSKAYK